MKILDSDFLLVCNEKFDILQNMAICFDIKIVEIDKKENLVKKYPQAKILPKQNIILPALINPHVHLEFSSNKALLSYGDFILWLKSVIKNRDEIMELATKKIMSEAIEQMLKSGVGTFGAISSAGFDLEVCVASKARVVFFNEILGSNPASADVLFEDFKSRLAMSMEQKSDRFIPSVSVHSPYSTHPILAKKALEIASENDMVVSTHFMESLAEREWVDGGNGDFVDFFKPFNPYAKPFLKSIEFLELFKENKTLYTHCCYVSNSELEKIKAQNATITHCPRSNRLLGSKKLELENVFNAGINLTLGTDGLSSNNTLNIWDELRASLFSQDGINLGVLAKELIKSATTNGAKALGLENGSLEVGKYADIISINLEQMPKDLEQIAMQIILHTKEAKEMFINGEEAN